MRHAGSKFCRCVNVHEAHVGTTHCVTWSIDRIINMHSRISWGVECIRAIFFHIFIVCLTYMTTTILIFSMFDLPGQNATLQSSQSRRGLLLEQMCTAVTKQATATSAILQRTNATSVGGTIVRTSTRRGRNSYYKRLGLGV